VNEIDYKEIKLQVSRGLKGRKKHPWRELRSEEKSSKEVQWGRYARKKGGPKKEEGNKLNKKRWKKKQEGRERLVSGGLLERGSTVGLLKKSSRWKGKIRSTKGDAGGRAPSEGQKGKKPAGGLENDWQRGSFVKGGSETERRS